MTYRTSENSRYQILQRDLITPTIWSSWYAVTRNGKEWVTSYNDDEAALNAIKARMEKLIKRAKESKEYKLVKIKTIIISEDVIC